MVGILGFVLLFSSHAALATSTWNQASNDCKSMSIVNATTNQGYENPCWPLSSVSADKGETINIRIYYHNTGTVTATNTRLVLTPATSLGSSSTSKSFSGRIISDQGSLSIGPVTANISSSQSLSFISSKWYTNNTSETRTPLLNGQSGEEVIGNGLDIGSIAPGWSTQGSVVVAFRVSSNVAPELCKDTSATNYNGALPCQYPAQVCRDTSATNYGGSLPCVYPQLCKDTSATNYNGALPCQYPVQVCRDTSATNYGGSLPCVYPQLCKDTSATNYNGALPCTYPQPVYCTILKFSANPTSITSGNLATLNWSTSDCTKVTISNLSYNIPTSGVQAVWPTQTTTYILTAYSSTGATQTKTATVYVNQPSSTCLINNFSASPSSIEKGSSSVLNWSTSDCANVTISNLSYGLPNSGSQAVYPTITKTYTLTAYGLNGGTQTRTATVYVDENNNDNECSIDSFTASDTSVEDGDSTTLRWNTSNCDRVKISDIGSVADDGSEKVYPDKDVTYILTAYNTDGSTETDTLRIYVDDNNNNNDCSIDSFTANDIYINSGDSVTLRWSTTDCDDVSISGIGDVNDDESKTIYPNYTTTYTLRASGNNGSDSKSIQINVNYNPIIPPTPIYNSNVVTTVATNITQTSAQLNGFITNSNYGSENTYFEYGTTVNLGKRTATHTVNGNTNFSEYVTSLSPNTIYFFQAFSEGSNGVSRGAIEVFKTLPYSTGVVTPVRQVIVQGPTVSSSTSPIVLRIENKYQAIGVGDIIDYTVYYKNISSSKLTNPMVQVFVPKGITLINTSRGTYSEDDRTLSVPIEDLNPSDEGVIYLQARVDTIDANLAQIVTTAILVYTNPNGAQENAMAYVLNNPKVINLLGASAFFGNIFGLGLLGWLLLIILILLLVLIARSLYNRRSVVTATTQKTINQ